MKNLRTANTGPELLLRSALHNKGLRFRIHRRDLPGRPDIVFVKARLVIFVDGCFWHGCPIHRVAPKSNADFWNKKIEENQRRDQNNDRLLVEMGWRVLHIWEHEAPADAADRIAELLNIDSGE